MGRPPQTADAGTIQPGKEVSTEAVKGKANLNY